MYSLHALFSSVFFELLFSFFLVTLQIVVPTASTVQLTSSRHVTPKGQTRDPIIFEAPYLHNGAR